eukprot:scaffold772_cov361-Prasinococcus_capsulatus_cf.AAC.7
MKVGPAGRSLRREGGPLHVHRDDVLHRSRGIRSGEARYSGSRGPAAEASAALPHGAVARSPRRHVWGLSSAVVPLHVGPAVGRSTVHNGLVPLGLVEDLVGQPLRLLPCPSWWVGGGGIVGARRSPTQQWSPRRIPADNYFGVLLQPRLGHCNAAELLALAQLRSRPPSLEVGGPSR